MKENWLYQLWHHRGQEPAVHLIETFENETAARNAMRYRNIAERDDIPRDLCPDNYYFVRPTTERQILEAERERMRLRKTKEWKRLNSANRNLFMQQPKRTSAGKGDWYYQIWEHHGQEKLASAVGTYRMEEQALETAFNLYYTALKDCRDGDAPSPFFFVQPVCENWLKETTVVYFRQGLAKIRRTTFLGFRGNLHNWAEVLAEAMLRAIEHCDWTEHNILIYKGGVLTGYDYTFSTGSRIQIYAYYSGGDRICLAVSEAKNGCECECRVKEFADEIMLKKWLADKPEAEAVLEDRLTDMLCSRYLPPEKYAYY